MTKMRLTGIAVFIAAAFSATDALAVASRTFVSSAGNDGNAGSNCSRIAPCRNFSAAYSVTTAKGEIIALDTDNFGPLTISVSMTVMAVPGQKALVTVNPGTVGVTVGAGASDVVILRNLAFVGSSGTTIGVQATGGRAIIQNSTFSNLSIGVNVIGKHDVIDSDFQGNLIAVRANGEGVDTQASPFSGSTILKIAGGNFIDNGTAFQMFNPGSRPAPATDNKISIFVRLIGNSTADFSVNITGNTTVTFGSGTGCSAVGSCQQLGTYSSTTNP